MKPTRAEVVAQLIDAVPPKWRDRWCDPSGGCACQGCANNAGGLAAAGVTRAEWVVSRAVKALRECMQEMTPEQRLALFGDLVEGYCTKCGAVAPDGRGCQCWNDE